MLLILGLVIQRSKEILKLFTAVRGNNTVVRVKLSLEKYKLWKH